jgi:hypothetical protein
MAAEKYDIPLAIDVALVDRHDTKAIVPVLRELADGGFRDPALGITVEANARGRDGQFISRRNFLGGGRVLCLAEPLPAVEHHL